MTKTAKDMIALQEWWIGEVKALTQKVITTEEKRQAIIEKKIYGVDA